MAWGEALQLPDCFREETEVAGVRMVMGFYWIVRQNN
jgi:hypothetical protein